LPWRPEVSPASRGLASSLLVLLLSSLSGIGLHAYGLAVDLYGLAGRVLRRPCFGIAARKGVVCPYGPWDRADWNHCQPTSVKIIMAENPLRATVTAEGPSNLGDIFEAGNPLIESMTSAADSLFRATPMPVRFVGSLRQRT
jgi:hypothetical protein